jgi:hypothetical protein
MTVKRPRLQVLNNYWLLNVLPIMRTNFRYLALSLTQIKSNHKTADLLMRTQKQDKGLDDFIFYKNIY